MAKPTILPVWNTDATNRTTPSGGQQASGWTSGQTAISAYFNWLFFTIYSWILWLDAGILTGVSFTATGNISTAGQYLHGDKFLCLGINDGAKDTSGNAVPGGTDQTYTTGGAAPWSVTTAITIPVGKRIKLITMYYNNASNSSVSGKLIAVSTTGVASDVSGGGISSPASTGNLNTSTGAMTKSVIATEALYWYSSASHTTSKVYWIKITYDEV